MARWDAEKHVQTNIRPSERAGSEAAYNNLALVSLEI